MKSKALEFLKEQKQRHQNMADSMKVVYFDDELDEAIEELDKFITNYQGFKRILDKALEALNNLNKNCYNCIHKGNKENYDLECCECKRFYGDKFEANS